MYEFYNGCMKIAKGRNGIRYPSALFAKKFTARDIRPIYSYKISTADMLVCSSLIAHHSPDVVYLPQVERPHISLMHLCGEECLDMTTTRFFFAVHSEKISQEHPEFAVMG